MPRQSMCRVLTIIFLILSCEKILAADSGNAEKSDIDATHVDSPATEKVTKTPEAPEKTDSELPATTNSGVTPHVSLGKGDIVKRTSMPGCFRIKEDKLSDGMYRLEKWNGEKESEPIIVNGDVLEKVDEASCNAEALENAKANAEKAKEAAILEKENLLKKEEQQLDNLGNVEEPVDVVGSKFKIGQVIYVHGLRDQFRITKVMKNQNGMFMYSAEKVNPTEGDTNSQLIPEEDIHTSAAIEEIIQSKFSLAQKLNPAFIFILIVFGFVACVAKRRKKESILPVMQGMVPRNGHSQKKNGSEYERVPIGLSMEEMLDEDADWDDDNWGRSDSIDNDTFSPDKSTKKSKSPQNQRSSVKVSKNSLPTDSLSEKQKKKQVIKKSPKKKQDFFGSLGMEPVYKKAVRVASKTKDSSKNGGLPSSSKLRPDTNLMALEEGGGEWGNDDPDLDFASEDE